MRRYRFSMQTSLFFGQSSVRLFRKRRKNLLCRRVGFEIVAVEVDAAGPAVLGRLEIGIAEASRRSRTASRSNLAISSRTSKVSLFQELEGEDLLLSDGEQEGPV